MRYACSPAMCRSFASAPAQPPVRTPLNTYGERIGGKLPFIAMTAEEPWFSPVICNSLHFYRPFLVHYLLTAVNRDFMADNSTRWLKKSCVAEFLTGVGKISGYL